MNHLVWFRNDLRIDDNTSLTKACEGEKTPGYKTPYVKYEETQINSR